ncbi:MAG TPA: GtrA family protein [Ktedonobacterales bacterium]|nr:GtrA family protein [Ktedonobacterales bacterium]
MTDRRTRDELSGAASGARAQQSSGNQIETQPMPSASGTLPKPANYPPGYRPVFPVYGPRSQSASQPALDQQESADPAYLDYGVYGGRETADDQRTTQAYPAPTVPGRSYEPTRWDVVNGLLAWTDDLTHGKAGLVQRLFTYLLIGGTAALVNLGILAILYDLGNRNNLLYYIFANAVAYEISIMANFVPNDYFTFRHMAGHQRSWAARCLRFHITSIGGIIVTFAISTGLKIGFHLTSERDLLIAQAIALIIAVFFNFTVHHLFTYSGKHE